MGKSDLMQFGVMLLALFVIAIVAGVTFIATPYLKDAACEATDATYEWEGGACLNETGGTAVTIDAITQIGVVEAALVLVLSLLTLVVIVLIFQLIIKVAKGFGGKSL